MNKAKVWLQPHKFSKDEVVRDPNTNEIYKDENGKTVKKYIHSGVQDNTYII